MKTILYVIRYFAKELLKPIAYMVYRTIDLFISPSNEIKPKSILLIRLDAIGDYVLFRNFIELLKNSQKYKDYSITLLGNISWKNLSEELDGQFIDKFIWVNRSKFMTNLVYRYRKLKEITSSGYEVVISPVYTRDFFRTDFIVRLVNAKEKIGSFGDPCSIKNWQRRLSDRYYTKLIPTREGVLFEFYRNKEFFENLIGHQLNIRRPSIEPPNNQPIVKAKEKYAVIFIGASDPRRRWSMEKFAKIARHLKDKYNYEIVLCGGSDVLKDSESFTKFFSADFLNLVGRISLSELINVLYHSSLILSNESSAVHIAAALNVPNIFVIYNANEYGRFVPYPNDITRNFHVILHPKIQKDPENYGSMGKKYGYLININEITVEMVKQKIDQILERRCV